MNFLQKSLEVALVDPHDQIIGRLDRWETHRKGLLHRGFTLLIEYKDMYVIQHRKHPVFDSVFDTTISSHPYYIGNNLQPINEAIYATLLREWQILPKHLLSEPQFLGKFTYRAPDPKSDFTEHEVCHVFQCITSVLPEPVSDTAYGYKTQLKNDFLSEKRMDLNFAPWVLEMIKRNLFDSSLHSI